MVWRKLLATQFMSILRLLLPHQRIVDVQEPYTAQFEDGLYSVEFINGNTNWRDVEIKNSVSVGTNNTTGFINPIFLEHGTFNGKVTIDIENGFNIGEKDLVGNDQYPVKTISEALIIAGERGFDKLYFLNSSEINGGSLLTNFTIEGKSRVNTILEIEASAQVENIHIVECSVFGTLDGGTNLENCIVGDITYMNGHIYKCALNGIIIAGGGKDLYIIDCSRLDVGVIPEINMGGSGQDLVMPNYSGAVKITNMNGNNKCGIGLNSGVVMLDSTTVISGSITVSGIGQLVDESGTHIPTGTWNGGVTITNNLINQDTISNAIGTREFETGYTYDEVLRVITAVLAGKTIITDLGGGLATVKFRDLADTKDRVVVDMDGSERTNVTIITE